MKKLLFVLSTLLLVACANDSEYTVETDDDTSGMAEQAIYETSANEGGENTKEGPVAENHIGSDETLPGSLELLNDMLKWESYSVTLGSLKQYESEELMDEETYIVTSYVKKPAEIYYDYKSIAFSNNYYEVYANEQEGFMNDEMEGWKAIEHHEERLIDKMPSRVKLLRELTLASTYIDNETVEGDQTRDLYELEQGQLTKLYQNLDAFIVYGKVFNELSKEKQAIVNETALANISSGRFHLIYDVNERIVGYEVVMAFNESDPSNSKLTDIFVISEAFSDINATRITRPEEI